MTHSPTDNYISLVPHYTFAQTLAEQEAQLAVNPLLARLQRARQALAEDPYRPFYHYVNPESTLNDPNGLCYWQGRWHLFYQAYPPEDSRQHWGHAVSDDLIHWRDLPYAIYPNPEECCFSGSALVEDDRVIAIYHGTKHGNIVAVSDDPLLLNWEKLTGQAVIPIASADGTPLPYRIHDPCIWRKDGVYYALSNGRDWWRPLDYLFRSEDLIHWDYLHPFVEGDRFTLPGDDGACPYFWPIGERHILLYFSHHSGGQAFLGDYDSVRDKFQVSSHHKFNFGAIGPGGVHAPSATPDGEGGVVVIFNMNEAKPTQGWNQIMSLPRRLTLLGPDTLAIEPTGDVESLRRAHSQVKDLPLPANQEILLDGIAGNALEILAEIDAGGASSVEMCVLRSPGPEEYTRIVFFPQRGYWEWESYGDEGRSGRKAARESLVSIDTTYSSTLPDVRARPPETGPVYLPPGEALRLRVFVDKSVVELFVNDRLSLAVRVYPGRADSIGVSLRAQGQDAHLRRLDAWQMQNIYA
ncbi:MAG: glycoside hydrolase family 32 protein [Caldilineaceae bacterium]|nr:glycoside hydrolase family 32 protein [Caldilineaceae bacterium]HRJ41950.1 glycoside hydrolase family 32 protein [Caldilineaceae bacterium]